MKSKYLVGILLLTQVVAHSAYAASISNIIVPFGQTISALKLGKGTVGQISLFKEGLNGIPVVSAVLGTVTIAQGANIVESLSFLQRGPLIKFPSGAIALTSLPGLDILKGGASH